MCGLSIGFVAKQKQAERPSSISEIFPLKLRSCLFVFGGKVNVLSHRKGRKKRTIGADIPEPNENVTMTMGNKTLVDAVFADTGLDGFLDSLKRDQGDRVSLEVTALVSNSNEMTGMSVSRMDRMLGDDVVREECGLGSDPRSVYRTIERIGRNSDAVVRFLGTALKERYGVTMETIFMDWTSMYFESPGNSVVRFGYSRDHRPNRPQVTVGLSVDEGSGMPVGLTVMPGDIPFQEHHRVCVQGPQTRDRLETCQMHLSGCGERKDPDIVPGAVLLIDDTFPVSGVQNEDGGIDIRGT